MATDFLDRVAEDCEAAYAECAAMGGQSTVCHQQDGGFVIYDCYGARSEQPWGTFPPSPKPSPRPKPSPDPEAADKPIWPWLVGGAAVIGAGYFIFFR